MYGQYVIMETLHENAQSAIRYQEQYSPDNSVMLDPYAWFVTNTYNDWDYKQSEDWQVPYDSFNGKNMDEGDVKNWTQWIYFDGELISADKFGNINLGYVGTKMGYSGFMLQNPTTMDKDDGPYLQYGIDMAKQGR